MSGIDYAEGRRLVEAMKNDGMAFRDGVIWLHTNAPMLLEEIERLRRWKSEALPVMDGLQELGRSLGVGLGQRITGRNAVDAALDLRNDRDAARAELAALKGCITALALNLDRGDSIDRSIASDLRALLGEAS